MIAKADSQSEHRSTEYETRDRKKKCAGNCANCLKKRAAQRRKVVAMGNSVNSTASLAKLETLGVEFDGMFHRTNWRGCFAGTPDF